MFGTESTADEGFPGGGIAFLFIIFGTMSLSANQISTIVALAPSINPVLDMFETMNNVTGDLIYIYTAVNSENLIDSQ